MNPVLISWSIAYDYIMDYSGNFADHILHDHTQRISMGFGIDRLQKLSWGTGQNIAYTNGLLGGEHILLWSVGKDFVTTAEWESIINYTSILKCDDVYTASAYIITDTKNNQITPFYAWAMARAYEQSVNDIADKTPLEYAIISPNNTQAMLKHLRECKWLGIYTFFDPGQATTFLSEDELREWISLADVLLVNEYEYELIQHRTGYTNEDLHNIISKIIVTKWAEWVDLYTNWAISHIEAIACSEVVDPTGAWDALRWGMLFGLQKWYELNVSLRIWVVCAWYCIQVYWWQWHVFTVEEIQQKYKEIYGENMC